MTTRIEIYEQDDSRALALVATLFKLGYTKDQVTVEHIEGEW